MFKLNFFLIPVKNPKVYLILLFVCVIRMPLQQLDLVN